MRTVTDHTGMMMEIPDLPQRIISLVPSQTELLFDLGLGHRLVGLTRFCVHPEAWFRTKTRVGGTKKVEVERVKGLGPDLVIANKEENTREDVEAIRAFCPVFVTDVDTVEAALRMIRDLAFVCRLELEGGRLEAEIRASLSGIRPLQQSAAYLIWKDPYMAAGGDTFISHMMSAAGIENVFWEKLRYPQVTLDEIRKRKPTFVLLSSEPYPFKNKHLEVLSEILPEQKVLLVDGEMFSWYGSRMRHFTHYIQTLLPTP